MTPLRKARRSDPRDLSQKSVAEAVGIDPAYYCRIEKGLQPSATVAQKIVAFLGPPLTEEQVLYPERFTSTQEVA